jgi:predicted patatin/cPLA2 family phospholipase
MPGSTVRHRRNAQQRRYRFRTATAEVALPILCSLMLQGCLTLPRGPAVPRGMTAYATTPAASNSRYWPDLEPSALLDEGIRSIEREISARAVTSPSTSLPASNSLAISGGGDAGAFGAGILVGWSAEGTRPEFKLVTGVSAGALIAPFAFLGPRYDGVLRSVTRSIGPNDIYRRRSIVAALSGDGFADDRPLAYMIAKYITPEVLQAVAHEYARGRLLLIGTTDLDAGQRVTWNMGAIASSADPAALTLFRQVMLASTAIPGMFPPVMIDVELNGRRYQEMHVDGGVVAQVFLLPPGFLQDTEVARLAALRERNVFVIRNGHLQQGWRPVSRSTTKVARQALDTFIDAQTLKDLYRLEADANKSGEAFHVAFIDDAFSYPHKKAFAADYMQRLFDYSSGLASTGNAWHPRVPNASIIEVRTSVARIALSVDPAIAVIHP